MRISFYGVYTTYYIDSQASRKLTGSLLPEYLLLGSLMD